MPQQRQEISGTVTKKHEYNLEIDNFNGINLTDQDDILEDNDSPLQRNVRKFAVKASDKRVGVSTRKGSGFYSIPIGETEDNSNTATATGNQTISLTKWQGMKLEPTTTKRLTKESIRIRRTTGSGVIRIEVHEDNGGIPGAMIAESSIATEDISDTYQDLEFRFISAPLLEAGATYWTVVYLQKNGTGEYEWESTSGSDAISSNIGIGGFSPAAYSLKFSSYLSDDGPIKGVFRYNPTDGNNETVFAHGSSIYRVTDDDTGTTEEIKTGLNELAVSYNVSYFQNLALICNDKDTPQKWSGSAMADLEGISVKAQQGVFYKNRLFLLKGTRLDFSEPAAFETFFSVNFLYVPRPESTDTLQFALEFQDNLVLFTKRSKYILYGANLSNFILRQSLGKNGTVSQNGVCSDGNSIFFIGNDNVYEFNGAEDKGIGDDIQPLLDGISDKDNLSIQYHNNEVRIYYAGPAQPEPQMIAIYNTTHRQWFVDSEAYALHTTVFDQEDNRLIEGSSVVGALYRAEVAYNNLGAPIMDEWHGKYHSFGEGARKKRVKRLFTMIRTQSTNSIIELHVDRDFRNSPLKYEILGQGTGAKWDQFNWNEATWATEGIKNDKKTIPGSSHYMQFRYINHMVDSPMEILKQSIYYTVGRLS